MDWNSLAGVGRSIARRFEVDTRSLAALRIALGVAILLDLVHRAGRLALFYTGQGVYPISVHEIAQGRGGLFSVYAVSDAFWVQAGLFVLAGLVAVAFVGGYRTRTTGVVSLVLLVSLHIRNPLVLNGGDRLLRVLLFVALLTPLGERWSIDARRRTIHRSTVTNLATVALLTQSIAVFTANALLKRRGDLWYAGDAVEVALYDTTVATAFGGALLELPALLTVLTYGWVVLLAGAIPLLLVTTGRLRAIAVAGYLAAFAGMALSLAVGLFPLALAASVLPFVPACVWDGLARRVSPLRRDGRWGTLPGERPESLPSDRIFGRDLLGFDAVRSKVHSFGQSLLLVLAAVVLVWIVLFTAFDVTATEPPASLDSEHLDQQDWGLYAPDPWMSYSWYVTAAELEGGTTIDVRDGDPVSFDRPPNSRTYSGFRYRSFMLSVDGSSQGDAVVANHYASWACDRAISIAGTDVDGVAVYRFYQEKPTNGGYPEPQRTRIVDHECR